MKVSVVGLGYVGIPLAVVLASKGYKVAGIQRHSPRSWWKISWLNLGKSPIGGEEPMLDELLVDAVESGRLWVCDDYGEIQDSSVVVVTVQTPVTETKEPDLSHLEAACRRVGENLSQGTLVSIESTVPPYTTETFVKPILEEKSGLKAGVDFNLVFCYERVTPGRLIENLVLLPRIVGGYTPACAERGAVFYASYCEAQIFKTDLRTAEVSKLVENSHRDVNIAFANEAALICSGLGVDFYKVREMVNSLPIREGSDNPYRNILTPGSGVGGHCLPKDPYLLLHGMKKSVFDYMPSLIPAARSINDLMPVVMKKLIDDALEEAGRRVIDSKIGVLGLSYKEDTGDPRNSPTLRLLELLGGSVKVHDPYVSSHESVKPQPLIDTVLGSDCLVVMTKHREYRELELDCIASMMRTRTIVDGRGLFDPEECIEKGFIYRGVGYATH
ncbi:nucleotide sugar dehydrogenase [Candidatus Bathyarchaeota archaeon]|nr:MAG: nucleotide sugar dehydrogenase [Candidatus Bathyarchaeota archaeon]HHL41545.1 nucleotide sugar dehydrogenase [Candidatus Bathyarchaeota archaeon]